MGTSVSQVRLHQTSTAVQNQSYCPKCSSVKSNFAHPICLQCSQRDRNNPKSALHERSIQVWCCNRCSFENSIVEQRCIVCGNERIQQNKRKSFSTDNRNLSAMRPMSVSVRQRRELDKTDAEKISQNVIAYCQQNKIPFVDDQFSPSPHSLGNSYSDHITQWLPLVNIAPSTKNDRLIPWTIYNSPQPSDIHQGELGDCWLMAALALITERPRMLQHIFLTKTVNAEGVYVVRICHNGLWKAILLDGYFPCTIYNKLAYSRAARRQLYVPLIEKACAKLFGSYTSLEGGSTVEGLQLLTGAPCDRIKLNPKDDVLDADFAWAKLLSACESKLLIDASTGRSDVTEYEYRLVGLNANHAFTVLEVKVLSESSERVLRIRDPHGSTNYLDDSITPSILNDLQSINDKTQNSSGIFWIEWYNFLRFFDSITISTYVSDHFDIREVAQFTRSATELVPAYYFNVSRTSLITVSLLYHRHSRKQGSKHTQSFVLCNVEEETTDVGTKDVILESHRGAFTYWSGSLRPGAYVIIPFSTSFWNRNNNTKHEITRDYTLVIHSSTPISGGLLKEPPTLLADCLIAATIKYCKNPKKSPFSVFYVTPSRFATNLVVVENPLVNHYLTFNMTITNDNSIYNSRYTFWTHDCIPARHRQLICILEWTAQNHEILQMSYTTSQAVSTVFQQRNPAIAIDQDDLHSPRSF